MMPKARHEEHGERKQHKKTFQFTTDALAGLQKLAETHQVSMNELLNQIGLGKLQLNKSIQT